MIAILETSVCWEIEAQSNICGFVLGVRVNSLQTEVMGKEC